MGECCSKPSEPPPEGVAGRYKNDPLDCRAPRSLIIESSGEVSYSRQKRGSAAIQKVSGMGMRGWTTKPRGARSTLCCRNLFENRLRLKVEKLDAGRIKAGGAIFVLEGYKGDTTGPEPPKSTRTEEPTAPAQAASEPTTCPDASAPEPETALQEETQLGTL